MTPTESETKETKELKGGRYVLVRTLGEGSQGETYEAIDNGPVDAGAGARADRAAATASASARRKQLVDEWERYVRTAKSPTTSAPPKIAEGLVAIKCFRVGKAKAWKDVELAEREATTLRSLDHPRLPRYIEHFEENGALYLVMEKIEGESLAALRKRKRTWTAAEVTKMLEDAGDALRYLHAQSPGIVHRDIKPGNVIRRPDGSFAIVDFGSVRDRLKPAGGSTVVGTFGYMAPEQFQGRASPKSDVYGVAATALAMLTGEEPEDLPHEGLGIDVARAVPRNTPAPLVRALTAMLIPDPDRRVGSVDEALALMRRGGSPPADSRAPFGVDPATAERFVRDAHAAYRGVDGAVRTAREAYRKVVAEERKARKAKRRQERAERQRRRTVAGRRAVPLLPRLVAQVFLLLATVVVWIAVGLVVPLMLLVLSLIFGSALRRAARACVGAARQSQDAMLRAASWLRGARPGSAAAERARMADQQRSRVAVPPNAGGARVEAVPPNAGGARVEAVPPNAGGARVEADPPNAGGARVESGPDEVDADAEEWADSAEEPKRKNRARA